MGRSSFDEIDGVLAARALPPESVPIEVRDLNNLTPEEQSLRIDADMHSEVHRPFDLTAGPAIRCIVYRGADNQTGTLLVAHHIAVDAWSMALIEREVTAACAAVAPIPARRDCNTPTTPPGNAGDSIRK